MNNVGETIVSQYANSPTLLQLIQTFNVNVDPAADIDNFYNYVFNIETAQGFGLDIWGKILGVTRYINVASASYFGFTGVTGRTNASGDSFGGGPSPTGAQPFYSGQATTANFALSDDAYRVLLYAKALYNITSGSIQSINQILINLFIAPVSGRTGNVYVTDGEDMTMTYTFDITPPLTQIEYSIVSQSGVLPRPTGVSATVVQL